MPIIRLVHNICSCAGSLLPWSLVFHICCFRWLLILILLTCHRANVPLYFCPCRNKNKAIKESQFVQPLNHGLTDSNEWDFAFLIASMLLLTKSFFKDYYLMGRLLVIWSCFCLCVLVYLILHFIWQTFPLCCLFNLHESFRSKVPFFSNDFQRCHSLKIVFALFFVVVYWNQSSSWCN